MLKGGDDGRISSWTDDLLSNSQSRVVDGDGWGVTSKTTAQTYMPWLPQISWWNNNGWNHQSDCWLKSFLTKNFKILTDFRFWCCPKFTVFFVYMLERAPNFRGYWLVTIQGNHPTEKQLSAVFTIDQSFIKNWFCPFSYIKMWAKQNISI